MNTSLEQFKDYLLANSKKLNYYNSMKVFLDFCANTSRDFTKITMEDIVSFFNSKNNRDKEYSINSRNMFIKAGRAFYDFLKVEKNVWKEISFIKPEQKIPDYITIEELNKAISYIKTNSSEKFGLYRVEALLMFMFDTGVRRNELLTLKRASIDLEKGTAKVYGKGDKERFVSISEETLKVIKTYFQNEPEEVNAFNVTLGQLKYIFERLLTKIIGRQIYPHLIRHSMGHSLHNSGMTLEKLSQAMGHSRLETTMIYMKSKESEVQEDWKKKMKNIHKGKQKKGKKCPVCKGSKPDDKKICDDCRNDLLKENTDEK